MITRKLFKRGRKLVLTMALFLFIFAAASVAKIYAAGNVTGWLWGGSEESSDGDSSNGLSGFETGLGWIKMSGTNYGVTIPASDGDVSGYAWSENIGWISFEAADLGGCPSGTCSARRVGDRLEGWARIMSIPQAAGNAGGWDGWISLSGIGYGVELAKLDGKNVGDSGDLGSTYAWSASSSGAAEFGWIDFGGALYSMTCNISSSSTTLDDSNTCRPLTGTLDNSANGETIMFSETSGLIALSNDSSCSDISSGSTNDSKSCTTVNGSCVVYAEAYDFTSNDTATIDVSNASCGSTSTTVTINKTLSCTIDAPSSVSLASGESTSYSVSVGGDAGCELNDCSWSSGSSKIHVSKGAGDTCDVSADADAGFDAAVSEARANSGVTDNTTVYVKRPGWIETNP
jgi:hypothetical protein